MGDAVTLRPSRAEWVDWGMVMRSSRTEGRLRDVGAAVFMILVSLFCGTYLELFLELSEAARSGGAAALLTGAAPPECLLRLSALAAALFAGIWTLASRPRLVRSAVRHRFALALVALVVLVGLEVSGSSVAMWGSYMGEDPYAGVLFGMPRAVRSDEWLVFTPFSVSQQLVGYAPTNPLIRGCATDVTVAYGQPAWALATLFRPFLWGHLALGPARGLSFFWCARALALVLATYECMLLLTDGRVSLAAYGAILVGFAPIVEWWFAVNGTAELLVFGQLLVVALHRLLRAEGQAARFGWSVLMAWCLGCYAMVIYPAWQVPLAYVFGCMGLGDLAVWLRGQHDGRGRAVASVLPALLCAAVLAVVGVGLSLRAGWDAVLACLNTAYPGQRMSAGGGKADVLLNGLFAPTSALAAKNFPRGSCVGAGFVSLFPLGALFAVWHLAQGARRRSVDVALLALSLPYALFLAYLLAGLPPLVAQVTLMGRTTPNRLAMAMGLLDVLLLVRSLSLAWYEADRACGGKESPVGTPWAVGCVAPVAVAALLVAAGHAAAPDYVQGWVAVMLGLSFAVLATPVLLPRQAFDGGRRSRGTWLVASALAVVAMGMCVNPVQQGLAPIERSEAIAAMRSVAQEDPDALWVSDDNIGGQALIMAGAPCISSVNVYPNLERWHELDPSGTYEETYNRYAHVFVEPGDKTAFDNPEWDCLRVSVTPDDLRTLGATYWLSRRNLPKRDDDSVRYEPVRKAGPYTIYRIVFP